jgi:hypothetical protein
MTAPDDDAQALRWIRGVVSRLADPAPEQLRYLRQSGIDGIVDELALEFEDTLPFVSRLEAHGVVPAGTGARFAAVNELLDQMSDAGDEVWSEAALSADPRWEQVRRYAGDALANLPE